MKLSAILQTYKKQLLVTISSNELLINERPSLIALAVASAAIWLFGPHLTWHDFAPFAQPGNRLFLIALCIVALGIKFYLQSRNALTIPQTADPTMRAQINTMMQRFRGAINFMHKTTINKQGKTQPINQLPWFVMLGPAGAGKTALLARSHAPYVLQKQFSGVTPEHFDPSDNFDWWITRNAGIIDVPSHYLFTNDKQGIKKSGSQQKLWNFFLSLLKSHGGAKNLSGIVIALPLPEMMCQQDSKAMQEIARTLSRSIRQIQAAMDKRLPCYLLITKCDLLPGFQEFFADIADDETSQPWGIMLPRAKKNEGPEQLFATHFNALLHKLNQQLLHRMHQERNPIARPYIKNFPLQIERLKSSIMDLIREINADGAPVQLSGVYLTSAQQSYPQPESTTGQPASDEHAVQVFQAPTKSRSYFIKHFISNGLIPVAPQTTPLSPYQKQIRYAVYGMSAAALISAIVILGKDFKIGFDQTRKIQTHLADYRNVLQEFHNPDESMTKTLLLLEALQKTKKEQEQQGILKSIINYYSNKSQQNASAVYYHSVQAFLIPEVRNYFADFLHNPINQDADALYRVFTAYLMLGDMTHFDSNYVRNVLTGILPKSFKLKNELMNHFDVAVQHYQPIQLDNSIISNTRKYLLSLRGTQLGYIILKSMSDNTDKSDALLGDSEKANALFTSKTALSMPAMFTSKNFVNVYEQQIEVAAVEAARGNWVLGTDFPLNPDPNYSVTIGEQLRTDYVKLYADAWETLLNNVTIEKPRDLEQADAIITSMTSYDSPLLRILNNIHENTFFEPITTASPKLFSIGQLIDRNNANKTELFQILKNLEALHDYLQPVLTAEDPKKAAYQLISTRMQHQGEPDPLTKLRIAADQSPMPVKGWINQLTNDTWHYLLQDAMRYMDTSWSEKVTKRFESHLAHRYPFNANAADEVSYQKFIHFFGNPGILTSYFNAYLTPFVDTSKPEWSWKKLNGQDLPLSADSLKQIQQAMQIHHVFFPKDDDELSVQFALTQKKLAKNIESIKFNINSKVIVDKRSNHAPHAISWPYNYDVKFSSIELNLAGRKPVQLDFPGTWGWFRLVNHAFESSRSNSEIILNFSKENSPAQYILSTHGKQNPFTGLNLNQFNLPGQLTNIQA